MMLNPYQKSQLISDRRKNLLRQSETLQNARDFQKAERFANIDTMKNFTLTYDRHFEMYDATRKNFKESYSIHDSQMDFKNDPDWTVKMRTARWPLLKMIASAVALCYFVYNRRESVALFDKLKRKEQRAMQNTEAEEFAGKKARFILFRFNKDKEFDQFTDKELAKQPGYTIFWYDPKMKNYLSLLEYMQKKGKSLASQQALNCYLIVDKEEHAQNVADIADQATDKKLKKLVKVALHRKLTEEE